MRERRWSMWEDRDYALRNSSPEEVRRKMLMSPRLMPGLGGAGGGTAPPDGVYFASNETPTTNAVQTADFRNGGWYQKTADQNAANGTPWNGVAGGSDGLGWGGTIFSPYGPPRTINLTSVLGFRPSFTKSDFAATTGFIDGNAGMDQGNNAWHNLFGGINGYNEIYDRFYTYFLPAGFYGTNNPPSDYGFSSQKFITMNHWNDDSGIQVGGFGFNVGSASRGSGQLMFTNNRGSNVVWHQNQGANINLIAGHFYYIEWHGKLNTPSVNDGVFEFWANDGGPTGDFSGQSPTLRMRFTTVDWGYPSPNAVGFGNIWRENWSPNDFPFTSDDFTGTNGANAAGRTTNNAFQGVSTETWAITASRGGTWDIQSNQVHCASNGGFSDSILILTSVASIGQTFIQATAVGDNSGVIFRFDPVSGQFYLWLAPSVVSGGTAILYKVNGSTFTQLATGSRSVGVGSTMRIAGDGPIIKAFVNGTLDVTVTDSTLTTGKPGLYGKSGTLMDSVVYSACGSMGEQLLMNIHTVQGGRSGPIGFSSNYQ